MQSLPNGFYRFSPDCTRARIDTSFFQAASQQSNMNSQPMVLFFGLDDPCECMVELTGRAERQMKNWPIEQRDGLQVIRFAMDQRKDLEAKFNVFHAPSLLLVDAQGRVV